MKKAKEELPAHPFRAIKKAGVPIVAFETADPQATIETCQIARNGKPEYWFEWDCIRGLRAIDPNKNEELLKEIAGEMLTVNLSDCLDLIEKNYVRPGDSANPKATFFIQGANRALADFGNCQAVWNLRDKFKAMGATLVLLGPAFRIPAELKNDVIVISEPLPGEAELKGRANQTCSQAGLELKSLDWEKIVDSVRGLSLFAAEQVVAMSCGIVDGERGLDMRGLWERKRKMVEQTPGLSVWRGGEKFDDIGGCDSIKAYLRDYMNGPASMRAVVWIDEIEKSLGNASGDLSNVTSDQLGRLLTYMQDSGARGMIFVGPPGAAKSAIAKCAGNEANVPTVALDLGGMKASLVGQSEMQLREALKVIDAISDGKSLWIATCNSLAVLPPELKRRFALGLWFFDLPDAAERATIWNIYADKYAELGLPKASFDITSDELPGWTGAEIKALFDTAWSTGRSLKRASKIIVPVCKSGKDKITQLRKLAEGNFTSAGKEGIYAMPEVVELPQGRTMEN